VIEMKEKELKLVDFSKYVGAKTKIAFADIRDSKFGPVLYLESKDIPYKADDKLPDGKPLRASVMLGLFVDENTQEFYIGAGTKASTFLKKKNISLDKIPDDLNYGDSVMALIGVPVVCQLNERGYLTIA
jgi:hypothetical protein